jgi:hypothetical protein
MVFKLVLETKKTWKKIKGYRYIPKVLQGITFVDGELPDEEERVAWSMNKGICLEKNSSPTIDNTSLWRSSKLITISLPLFSAPGAAMHTLLSTWV